MIVVSDTTPLRYLAVIGGLDWLPAVFGQVVCPPEVLAECRHERAPAPLRAWAAAPPAWLRVVPVSEGARALPVAAPLDAGEIAALCLARELRADLVLLVEAALRGVADFETALSLLATHTNFRVGESVIAAARARLAAGKARR